MFEKKCFDLQSAFQYAATQAYLDDVDDVDNEATQKTEVILSNIYYPCEHLSILNSNGDMRLSNFLL